MRNLFLILMLYLTNSLVWGAIVLNKVDIYTKDYKETEYTKKNDYFKNDIINLQMTYHDKNELREYIELFIKNEKFEKAKWKLLPLENDLDTYYLSLYVQRQPLVRFVDFKLLSEISLKPEVSLLKNGDVFDETILEKSRHLVQMFYVENGFLDVEVRSIIKKENDNKVDVEFEIDPKKPIFLGKIKVRGNNSLVQKLTEKKMSYFINSYFSINHIKTSLEELKRDLVTLGYPLIDFSTRYQVDKSEHDAQVLINFHVDVLHAFHFRKESFSTNLDLKRYLQEYVQVYRKELTITLVQKLLKDYFSERGYLYSKFVVKKRIYKNKNEMKVALFEIDITRGKLAQLKEVLFKGNNVFERSDLLEYFKKDSNLFMNDEFFDKKYLEVFSQKLKKYYVTHGHLSCFVEEPVFSIDPKTSEVTVLYKIREGLKATVKSIRLLDQRNRNVLSGELKTLLKTKIENPFNPFLYQADTLAIRDYFIERGYFNVELKNLGESVSYSNENTSVNIALKIFFDHPKNIRKISVLGNKGTLKRFILRESQLRENALITESALRIARQNLMGIGLFSHVEIHQIFNGQEYADLIIRVSEKPFGSIEIAPGIRTDIGPKLSLSIGYSNLDGMNKQMKFRTQVNQRYDLSSLDERRRDESNSLVEYDASLDYMERRIFNSNFDFTATLKKTRRRLYSFDADIQSVSNRIDRKIFSWLHFYLTHGVEAISQFDSTIEAEHGHFQIGSLTSTFSFNFLDSKMKPTNGLALDLTVERASPQFLSQENKELTIDYYSLLGRFRVYKSLGTKWMMATTFFAGQQESLAPLEGTTLGHIPSIKVFSLHGPSLIRGFDVEEANRLPSGEEISEVTIDSKAYLLSLKIEPRLRISDSSVLGFFYDAGRIFTHSPAIDNLRSSIGISYKYLTPVGSLDFDYGIKLLRKRDLGGTLESPGRLHVSIGFF